MSTNTKMRFSEIIQLVIWLLSLLGAAFFYTKSLDSLNGELGYYWVVLFGFTTLLLQILIYIDIHSLENNTDVLKNEYGRWIDHKIEKVLRYSLFLSLLLCAGKITDSIALWIPDPPKGEQLSFWPELIKHNGNNHIYLFIIGAFIVFFCQFLWNVFAFIYGKGQINNNRNTKPLIIKIRIVAFALSSLLASIYWLFFFIDVKLLLAVSIGLISFYLLFTVIGTLLKIPKLVAWIIRTSN